MSRCVARGDQTSVHHYVDADGDEVILNTATTMSSVFLTNVDDYLAPSQACVNPLFNNNAQADKKDDASEKPETPNVVKRRRVVRRRRKTPVNSKAGSSTNPVVPGFNNSDSSNKLKQADKSNSTNFSLADCLACSGCVTTAETVLVEQHSLRGLYTKCQEAKLRNKPIVVTISPASLADLWRYLQIEGEFQTWTRRVATFLHETCHASIVLDGNVPLSYSLLEAAHEFCHVFRNKRLTNNNSRDNDDNMDVVDPMEKDEEEEAEHEIIPPDTPSVAISSTQTRFVLSDGTSRLVTHAPGRRRLGKNQQQSSLPLLTSSCPALVCLVEKNASRAVSHLASTKSPMAVAASLCKKQMSRDCLHVAIMPCHDKKLEASRKDLALVEEQEDLVVPDTDLVITTQEWVELLREKTLLAARESGLVVDPQEESPNLPQEIRTYLETFPLSRVESSWDFSVDCLQDTTSPTLVSEMGLDDKDMDEVENGNNYDNSPTLFYPYGSGGYADFVFRYACRKLFGYNVGTTVPWKPVVSPQRKARIQSARVVASQNNNADFYQAVLYRHGNGTYSCASSSSGAPLSSSGEPVLRFATAYGLQNIQRVLQPLKTFNNNKSPYHYIEAMACPSGCLNGGGQVRIVGTQQRETPSETRQRVRDTQLIMQRTQCSSNDHMVAGNGEGNNSGVVYDNPKLVANGGPFGGDAQRLLHTRFHIVPPLRTNTNSNAMAIDTRW